MEKMLGHMHLISTYYISTGLGILEASEKEQLDVRKTLFVSWLLYLVTKCPRANLYLCEPHFSHLKNGDARSAYLEPL